MIQYTTRFASTVPLYHSTGPNRARVEQCTGVLQFIGDVSYSKLIDDGPPVLGFLSETCRRLE